MKQLLSLSRCFAALLIVSSMTQAGIATSTPSLFAPRAILPAWQVGTNFMEQMDANGHVGGCAASANLHQVLVYYNRDPTTEPIDTQSIPSAYAPANLPSYPNDPICSGNNRFQITVPLALRTGTAQFIEVWYAPSGSGPPQNLGRRTFTISPTNPVQSPNIQSVNWEAITSPLSTNPKEGGGKRIYPDREFSDSPSQAAQRKVVRAKALLATPLAGVTVYFKSFDLDDPSFDGLPVDSTPGSLGNDNRCNPQEGLLSGLSAVTNSIGVASVDLTVSMFPGDNFAVTASTAASILNGVSVNGIELRDAGLAQLPTPDIKRTEMLTTWRRVHMEVDSMGAVAGNYRTGTIAAAIANTDPSGFIWLTVSYDGDAPTEQNQYELGNIQILGVGNILTVAASNANTLLVASNLSPRVLLGKSFILCDDDDYNLNGYRDGDFTEDVDPPASIFSLLQESGDSGKNLLATAYIMPVYDGAGGPDNANNQSDVSFLLNVEEDQVEQTVESRRDSGSAESDDYWVCYVLMGYQSRVSSDGDPTDVVNGARSGDTPRYPGGVADWISGTFNQPPTAPRGGDGSLLYLESIFDVVRTFSIPQSPVNPGKLLPHEVGHQFGLKGDNTIAPGHQTDYGIMTYDSTQVFYVPTHINVLRWRIHSPGTLGQ